MQLTLEVTAVSQQPPQTPLRLQFREGSRLLGRNADNDLVLEDPERMVSGLHCRVEAAGDAFVLIDLSTNGTYLNDAPDPLPRSQPTPLQDGDVLQIGPYDIAVTIDAHEESDTGEPAAEAPPPLPGFATHIFEPEAGPATAKGLQEAPAAAAPDFYRLESDLFSAPSPGRAPTEEPQADDDMMPGLERPGAGADILDLLGDDEPGDGRLLEQAADPFAEPLGADDLLANSDAGKAAAPAPTPVDQVFFQAPTTQQASAPIPDDYDLLGDIGPDAVPRAQQKLDAAPTPPAEPIAPPPEEPPPAANTPEAAPVEEERAAPADFTDAEPTDGPPAATPPQPPRPEPGRRAATSVPQTPPTHSERAALDAFLAGLGIGDATQIADPDAFLRSVGALLRTMVAGLSTTLMARTQFKSEMRLGVTTIRATENNPLKFSVSVEDALERLLLRETRGFMPAQEAVKQGFEDIQAHEMAMIAGLRSALDELLGRFDPASLEAELADKSLDKLLPMVRKSRCWDLLGERHAQISAAASEDFMKVFGEAFSEAYDEQVALLARARRERGQ